jgi:hypothetical protein
LGELAPSGKLPASIRRASKKRKKPSIAARDSAFAAKRSTRKVKIRGPGDYFEYDPDEVSDSVFSSSGPDPEQALELKELRHIKGSSSTKNRRRKRSRQSGCPRAHTDPESLRETESATASAAEDVGELLQVSPTPSSYHTSLQRDVLFDSVASVPDFSFDAPFVELHRSSSSSSSSSSNGPSIVDFVAGLRQLRELSSFSHAIEHTGCQLLDFIHRGDSDDLRTQLHSQFVLWLTRHDPLHSLASQTATASAFWAMAYWRHPDWEWIADLYFRLAGTLPSEADCERVSSKSIHRLLSLISEPRRTTGKIVPARKPR